MALPGDIVKLSGTKRLGRVLDWETQIELNRRQLAGTHLAVQPVDVMRHDIGQVVFWPRDGVSTIEEAPRQARPSYTLDEFRP